MIRRLELAGTLNHYLETIGPKNGFYLDLPLIGECSMAFAVASELATEMSKIFYFTEAGGRLRQDKRTGP